MCVLSSSSTTTTTMKGPCKRSLPFIKALVKIRQNKDKLAVLEKFPNFVINDIVEILYNIINQNCNVSARHISQLRKHKKSVSQLVDNAIHGARYKSANRRHRVIQQSAIYKQKGGFLSVILPIIASVLGNLFG